MIFVAILSVFLLTNNANAASQEVTQAVDYSHCNAQGIGTMGIPYRIGDSGKDSGHLLASKLYRASVVKADGGNTEKFSYLDFWEHTKGKTSVVLNRKNGRPESLETQYDPKSSMAKGSEVNYGGLKIKNPGVLAEGTRFAYNGNHCFVSQKYIKRSDGKEVVHYDANVCAGLLTLAKKATVKKLAECKSTFAQMAAVIAKAKSSLKEKGQDFEMNYGFGDNGSKSNPQGVMDQDWVALSAIGSCNMQRQMYGQYVDPSTNQANNSFGMPYGVAYGTPFAEGGGFGAGAMGAGGAFGTTGSGEELAVPAQ